MEPYAGPLQGRYTFHECFYGQAVFEIVRPNLAQSPCPYAAVLRVGRGFEIGGVFSFSHVLFFRQSLTLARAFRLVIVGFLHGFGDAHQAFYFLIGVIHGFLVAHLNAHADL